jgi:hypothetical protein
MIDEAGVMKPAQGDEDRSGDFMVKCLFPDGMNVGIACYVDIAHDPAPSKRVEGIFYVTPKKVLLTETVTFTPLPKVTVWFRANATRGAVTGLINGETYEVDFTNGNPKAQTICYNASGLWQPGPLPASES